MLTAGSDAFCSPDGCAFYIATGAACPVGQPYVRPSIAYVSVHFADLAGQPRAALLTTLASTASALSTPLLLAAPVNAATTSCTDADSALPHTRLAPFPTLDAASSASTPRPTSSNVARALQRAVSTARPSRASMPSAASLASARSGHAPKASHTSRRHHHARPVSSSDLAPRPRRRDTTFPPDRRVTREMFRNNTMDLLLCMIASLYACSFFTSIDLSTW